VWSDTGLFLAARQAWVEQGEKETDAKRERVSLLQVIPDKAHPQTSDHATATLGVMA